MSDNGVPASVGRELMFDGMAQMFDSIPIEHVFFPAPAAAICATSGGTPIIVAPMTLTPAAAICTTSGAAPALLVPAIGPDGAYTIFFDLETGGRVRYSYMSDVTRVRIGPEYRTSVVDYPRRTYEFTLQLDDAQARDLKTNLFRNMPQAQRFNLALWHESLTLSADASGNTVFVNSTAMSEWCVPGRRVVVVSRDGTSAVPAVLGVATANTIVLSVAPGSVGDAGGSVMPTDLVWLEANQAFGYHPNNLEIWNMTAVSALQDPALGVLGTGGAALSTHLSVPVWDFPLSAESLVQTGLASATEEENDSPLYAQGRVQEFSDVLRTISLRCNSDARRQWVKKFFAACRGQQVAFYLPSWKYDALVHSQPSGSTIKIFVPPTVGAGDFAEWWGVSSHKSVMLWRSDGTYLYREVTAIFDNGDGTMTINVAAYTGTLIGISFLELVRFTSDDLDFHYEAGGFSRVEIQAMTVLQ